MRSQSPQYYAGAAPSEDNRKFAEKPNAMKKVALDDIDDIQTNQIQDSGFSWSNMLGTLDFKKLVNVQLLRRIS